MLVSDSFVNWFVFFVSFSSKGLMLLLGVIQRNFLAFVVHVL